MHIALHFFNEILNMNQIKQSAQSHPNYVKKSKFIASSTVVTSEEEANAFIEKIRNQFPKADHHPYAYRVLSDRGVVEIYDEDGEPPNTSGSILLFLLKKRMLVNTIVIVTRFYGGIKLGKGGLVKSYSRTATSLIDAVGIAEIK
jgi:putative IMPACT (imprinted ancient) family translation regulator